MIISIWYISTISAYSFLHIFVNARYRLKELTSVVVFTGVFGFLFLYKQINNSIYSWLLFLPSGLPASFQHNSKNADNCE